MKPAKVIIRRAAHALGWALILAYCAIMLSLIGFFRLVWRLLKSIGRF